MPNFSPQLEAAAQQEIGRRFRVPLPLWRLAQSDRDEITQRIAGYTATAQLYRDALAAGASEMEVSLFVGRLAGRYDVERQAMLDELQHEEGSNMAAAASHATKAAVAIRIVAEMGGPDAIMRVGDLLQLRQPVPS